MDEAASRIRMEVESKPEEIENLDRRIIQLKIEEQARGKESDRASKDRLAALRQELAGLEERSAELTTRWQGERDKIAAEGKIEEQLDAADGVEGNALLREEVTDDDIAAVVSRWTGVPVDRMMQGELEKLLKMEET